MYIVTWTVEGKQVLLEVVRRASFSLVSEATYHGLSSLIYVQAHYYKYLALCKQQICTINSKLLY